MLHTLGHQCDEWSVAYRAATIFSFTLAPSCSKALALFAQGELFVAVWPFQMSRSVEKKLCLNFPTNQNSIGTGTILKQLSVNTCFWKNW